MVKKILKKLGFSATVVVIIISAGWSLTTQQGSEFLAGSSAILVKSWSEIFGAGGVNAQVQAVALTDASATVGQALAKTSTVACWNTERQDLAKLAGLLRNSNASLADLAAKLTPTSGACPDEPYEDTAAPKNIIPAQCSVSEPEDDPSRQVILNEIAWMGSPAAAGESATKASNQEWIELKNTSAKAVALNGWQIVDSGGKVQIVFGAGDAIPAGGFYLLSRSGNAINGVSADKSYSGALSNSGDRFAVFDANCGTSDFLDALKGWPAGNNTTKQTMERKADAVGAASWQTSAAPGGTPRAENSAGLARYTVSVAIQGDGLGTVVSSPAGISCNSVALASGAANCSAQFTAGTALTLTASPGQDTAFEGWSGGCAGLAKCTLTVNGTVSANATFHVGLSDVQSESFAEATTDSSPAGHVLIAQIQIAGVASANDFVKIYNPTANAIDLSGWKLRKKSSTGTDASLRELPKGTSIGGGAYFTWANSADGFAGSLGADASSSQTLSVDNSVALFDASGALVDAVAWGKGVNQYVAGSSYPTNPAANQILQRESAADGGLLDTGNNANDFGLH